MKYYFHPQAEAEFLEAVDYYEQLEPGLGQDFALEIHGAIAAIVAYPHAWPMLGEDIHRCLVHRFPYGVLYAIEPTGISTAIPIIGGHGGSDHPLTSPSAPWAGLTPARESPVRIGPGGPRGG